MSVKTARTQVRGAKPVPSALVAPHAAMGTHGPGALVGDTPTLWVQDLRVPAHRGFWAKLEGHNPGGMKDRPALHMVEAARSRGELEPGGRIVDRKSVV